MLREQLLEAHPAGSKHNRSGPSQVEGGEPDGKAWMPGSPDSARLSQADSPRDGDGSQKNKVAFKGVRAVAR